MTDLTPETASIPGRLGVAARMEGDQLVLDLDPRPEVLRCGVVRASVHSFLIDAVAGIVIDDDPGTWSLTTDMSVRLCGLAEPSLTSARATVLRQGRRTATAVVDVTDASGAVVATGALGFAKVPRRDDDPPKPVMGPQDAARVMRPQGTLGAPLREAAGIRVVEGAQGVVEVEVTEGLRNSAGTLQGAMVALVVEAAAEELLAARFGLDAVVGDLDLRYLAQARQGLVRSRARLLGDDPGAPVEVTLLDASDGRITTAAYARAASPVRAMARSSVPR